MILWIVLKYCALQPATNCWSLGIADAINVQHVQGVVHSQYTKHSVLLFLMTGHYLHCFTTSSSVTSGGSVSPSGET